MTGRVSMIKCHRVIVFSLPIMPRLLLLSLLFSLGCGLAVAQATVEAAGATSVVGSAVAKATPPGWSAVNFPDNKGKSQHLPASSGTPSDVANRQALEQRAGKNPSKLLIRSTPTPAQVWIDGAFVGNSPMLLILAPGKYQVELRGPRMEYGSRAVDLLPRETREVAVTLAVRYPTRASVR